MTNAQDLTRLGVEIVHLVRANEIQRANQAIKSALEDQHRELMANSQAEVIELNRSIAALKRDKERILEAARRFSGENQFDAVHVVETILQAHFNPRLAELRKMKRERSVLDGSSR